MSWCLKITSRVNSIKLILKFIILDIDYHHSCLGNCSVQPEEDNTSDVFICIWVACELCVVLNLKHLWEVTEEGAERLSWPQLSLIDLPKIPDLDFKSSQLQYRYASWSQWNIIALFLYTSI